MDDEVRSVPGRKVGPRRDADQAGLFQALLDALPAHIAVLDADGTIVAVNAAWRAFARANGYASADEGLGGNYLAVCETATGADAQDARAAARGIREVIGGQRAELWLEYPCHTPDEERWFGLRAVLLANDGPTRVLVAHHNITPRKLAERTLRQSEMTYRELIEHMPLVTYTSTLDPISRAIYVSPQIESILGFSQAEWLSAPALWVEHIHPDERARVLAELERSHATLTPRQIEFRMLARDGRGVWLRDDATVVRDEDGAPLLWQGIVQDITERKLADRERAQHTEQLARLAESERRRQIELARSNALITALSRVAARIEVAPDPDGMVMALGAELRPLGLACLIMLLDPADQALVVRATSLDPAAVLQMEQTSGVPVHGFRLLRENLPIYADMVERRRALLLRDVAPLAASLLPGLAPDAIERMVELFGAGTHQQSAYLPLVVDDHVLGMLWLWGQSLREADLPALLVFAGQVASALDRARLFEELHVTGARLHELSRQLVTAQELERRQLARDLHDQIGQNLAVLNINLSIARAQLPPAAARGVEERLVDSQKVVEETAEHIRGLLAELRPAVLDDYGLGAALLWYVPHTAKRIGLVARMSIDEQRTRLPPDVEIGLFRIAQEALTNIAKHARARQVSVTLEEDRQATRLIIADDGVGFDVAAPRRPEQHWSLGLVGMRERAEALGGRLQIESAPGQGTTVIAEVMRHRYDD